MELSDILANIASAASVEALKALDECTSVSGETAVGTFRVVDAAPDSVEALCVVDAVPDSVEALCVVDAISIAENFSTRS